MGKCGLGAAVQGAITRRQPQAAQPLHKEQQQRKCWATELDMSHPLSANRITASEKRPKGPKTAQNVCCWRQKNSPKPRLGYLGLHASTHFCTQPPPEAAMWHARKGVYGEHCLGLMRPRIMILTALKNRKPGGGLARGGGGGGLVGIAGMLGRGLVGGGGAYLLMASGDLKTGGGSGSPSPPPPPTKVCANKAPHTTLHPQGPRELLVVSCDFRPSELPKCTPSPPYRCPFGPSERGPGAHLAQNVPRRRKVGSCCTPCGPPCHAL